MNDELKRIDLEKFEGNHSFLAEELLIPNASKCDSNRVNMFDSHLAQAVVLKDAEFPRVFTNFENQVGKYSSSYKVVDRDWTIVSKIIKNEENYILVVKDKNGYVDIIERKPAERITEYFGYGLNNDGIDGKKAKDVIEEGEIAYRSTAYDENLNFKYGLNLRAVYIPWKNMTFEDAIVISESAAKKLSSYTVEEVTVNINTNDILCNIYGNAKNYKCFPDIGEDIDNQIILSRRRINYDSAFFDLSAKNLSKINYATDVPFFAKGKVIDIDIFSNAEADRLEKFHYNGQILRYLKGNTKFYERVVEVLEPIVKRKGKKNYSDDVGYLYKRAKDIIDPEVNWRNEKSDFDNIIIRFTILKEQKLSIGSKLTGRYGNKGCISMILPDSEMPTDENGVPAEILLNPLGVVNRLNVAQLYEQEINFLSNYIVENMKIMFEHDDMDAMVNYFFDYIYNVNEEQYSQLVDYYNELDDDESAQFWADIFEKGIFIHQPPFYGNMQFDQLRELYKLYPDCKPVQLYVDGQPIENPLIMGQLYFMKLKHEAKSKFSARSSSYLNLKNIPSKSTRFKENQQLYPKTPIKVGEMELTNLFISNDIKEVVRFMSTYSTNEADRHNLINALITQNIFNIDKVEKSDEDNRTKQILEVYLKNIGLTLAENEKEEVEV
jgi:DNA-directed RNA polymerase beta subunit